MQGSMLQKEDKADKGCSLKTKLLLETEVLLIRKTKKLAQPGYPAICLE
jgi:hypothetical protein